MHYTYVPLAVILCKLKFLRNNFLKQHFFKQPTMQQDSAGDTFEFNCLFLISVCIRNFQTFDSLPTQGTEYARNDKISIHGIPTASI